MAQIQPMSAVNPAHENSGAHSIALTGAYDLHGILEYTALEHGGVRIRTQGDADAYIVLPFSHRSQHQKLRLRFRRLDNVHHLIVYFGLTGEPFYESRRAPINTAVPGDSGGIRSHHVRLPNGHYDRIRIAFRSRNDSGDVVLESLTVLPLELKDRACWSYVIALGLGLVLVLPGALTYVVVHGSRSTSAGFQVSFFAYSLLFYAVNSVILFGALELIDAYAHIVVLLCCMSLLTALAVIIQRKSVWSQLAWLIRDTSQEFAAFTVLLLLVTFTIIYDANLPLENFFYTDISGPKTFDAFRAHDNVFQYINGITIANDEPFNDYYGNNQLIYGVEDRQILPGVVYAVLRACLSPWSSTLEKSYLVYTVLGIAMNLMIVFPAAAIARRYLGINNTLLFLLLFSANAFVLVNHLITWFKISAAALFLSGLFYIITQRADTRGWIKSGLFFGLSANMHAGSALGLPLFVLWGALRQLRRVGSFSIRTLLGPVSLVVVFALVLAPWSIVKRVYLNEQHTLIKTHFLEGYSSSEGLGASARLFFDSVPLQEQVSQRLSRLKDSVRVAQIGQLYSIYADHGFKAFLKRWDQLEFNFLAILLYPASLFAIIGWFYRSRWNERTAGDGLMDVPTCRTMLTLSIVTIVLLILASYGRHAPDINYHLPMGVVALTYMVLIGFIWHTNRIIRTAYILYTVFAAYRLAVFL